MKNISMLHAYQDGASFLQMTNLYFSLSIIHYSLKRLRFVYQFLYEFE